MDFEKHTGQIRLACACMYAMQVSDCEDMEWPSLQAAGESLAVEVDSSFALRVCSCCGGQRDRVGCLMALLICSR